MNTETNVVDLNHFREVSQQAVIDDISAQAFLFMRDQAEQNNVPMKTLLIEHLLGIALVVKAVEGSSEAQKVLEQVSQQLQSF